MVDGLLEDGSLQSKRVERAFRTVERHRFLPGVSLDSVYGGEAIPIKRNDEGLSISSSSEPAVMAVMLEQLDIQPGNRVLEVGTGSGYNAALLAELVGDSGAVTTVDLEDDIVDRAARELASAGYRQVVTVTGDGWNGGPQGAPFDRIEVTVGVWDVSPHWVEQLVEGGILVVPLWLRAGVQASIAFRKRGDRLLSESVRRCGFMRLRGPQAGPEAYVPVDGWLACLDEVRPGDVELLSALLATDAREEAISAPPEGWFERLALDDPDAIRLVTADAAFRDAAGIFDRESESLAVIEGDSLRVHGSDEARSRLREWLTAGETLSIERLDVEAARRSTAPDRWTLRRPAFSFLLRGG